MLTEARGYVGARLARDEGDAVFQKSSRVHRGQALLPQINPLATKKGAMWKIDAWLTIFSATATSSYSSVIISMPSSPDPS
ncbi:hypothetical protein EMIT0P228_240056 [Pseudomonas brassicacearum]